ncbi:MULTISPECIES: type II toxin-antitoxin system HicA family toxin [unclassified Nostoc]|uniref:type II toxin-antitoxin system HicA family toxin n=1 Tax=unclassified Nostoc TaxID=2593658 RepID=UPI0025AA32A4|nr:MULTISPECIES: type II toxin-antitoxin system HicA family toxin [unclassified Nostoc]MDM9581851.1 type II toxin-antitoxin system HicA family toxin [Nostoc sp. GT001]MDZ7994765.1 type II toxin-antitoxin system HicA family toxin [Nostoc sp. EspVER01]
MTATEAEKLLLDVGFIQIRSKGSHRIYFREEVRVVIPFHSGKILHPKIVKQVLQAIDISENEATAEEVIPETDE